jgi:hypothetical protein
VAIPEVGVVFSHHFGDDGEHAKLWGLFRVG